MSEGLSLINSVIISEQEQQYRLLGLRQIGRYVEREREREREKGVPSNSSNYKFCLTIDLGQKWIEYPEHNVND